MGKPITESLNELRDFQILVKTLITIAPEGLAEAVIKETSNSILKYVREPVGVTAIFSSWTFPILTCAGMLITSVLAGNSAVIKPSPYAPSIAKHFEEAFKSAGVNNVVRELMIMNTDAVPLFKSPEIGFVDFIGSTEVGYSIQDELTDNVFVNYHLELCGNDAAYIAEDGDVDLAVSEITKRAFSNAGQTNCGIKKVYVHHSLYEDFLNKIIKPTLSYQPGDPLQNDTTLGPLTLPDSLHKLQKKKWKMLPSKEANLLLMVWLQQIPMENVDSLSQQ